MRHRARCRPLLWARPRRHVRGKREAGLCFLVHSHTTPHPNCQHDPSPTPAFPSSSSSPRRPPRTPGPSIQVTNLHHFSQSPGISPHSFSPLLCDTHLLYNTYEFTHLGLKHVSLLLQLYIYLFAQWPPSRLMTQSHLVAPCMQGRVPEPADSLMSLACG